MLAHTKKHRTKIIALTFTGPAAKADAAIQAMRELSFQEQSEAAPWKEALGYANDELPGVFLAGARYREGLTQAQLAQKTGIARRHISEMENNKRPIGKANARKLGEALGVDPHRFFTV